MNSGPVSTSQSPNWEQVLQLKLQPCSVCANYPEERWCTPWGQDVTYLCVRSKIGGFVPKAWTIQGWILDAISEYTLRMEFPEEWFLEVTCSLGFPCDYSEVLRLRHSSLAVRGNMSDGRANYRSGGGNHAAVAVPLARFRFKVSPRLRWRSRGGGPVEAMLLC